MKKIFLSSFLGLFVLAGCDRLNDVEFKSVWCEVWRQAGSQKDNAPYKQVLNKNYQCWVGGARTGMLNRCSAEQEQRYLKELNDTCDRLEGRN